MTRIILPTLFLAFAAASLLALRESLGSLPGVLPLLWIGWLALALGVAVDEVEDAHAA